MRAPILVKKKIEIKPLFTPYITDPICNFNKSQFVKVVACRLARMKISDPMLTEAKVTNIVFTALRMAIFGRRNNLAGEN
jgi:hypothetical protein